MESSDIIIELSPENSSKTIIDLTSSVYKQFGEHIRNLISETLLEMGINGVRVKAVDKGALDCVIRARVRAAACRAAETSYDWRGASK